MERSLFSSYGPQRPLKLKEEEEKKISNSILNTKY